MSENETKTLPLSSNVAPVAAKDCEWTYCPHRVGDVCCHDRKSGSVNESSGTVRANKEPPR